MKNTSQLSQLSLLLLFFLILVTSCGAVKSENTSVVSDQISVESGDPIIDSILQFNVMVTDIFEDSKGNFWFGSHGDGLCKYDGNNYTYFRANHGLPNGVMREFAPGTDWSIVRKINSSDQVGQIQEDKEGNIWIKLGGDEICKYDGHAFNVVPIDEERPLSISLSASEWKANQESLWFGGSGMAVSRFDGNKLINFTFPEANYQERDGVSEVYIDNEGTMWLGTMGNGTFHYDGQSFECINRPNEIGICRSAFQDKSGRVWITNNRYNLNYLRGDSLVNFIEEYSFARNDIEVLEEFPSGFQSINQDRNGDMWFGTFGEGLWRYDGQKLAHYAGDETFPIGIAKVVYKDRYGELWFGLNEGSVYSFDGTSFVRFDSRHEMH
jgi:hypothetical protein